MRLHRAQPVGDSITKEPFNLFAPADLAATVGSQLTQ
jgi:hypothetical protein